MTIFKKIALSVALTGGLSMAPADAEENRNRITVVELFTSQGCNSCPPADTALEDLRDRPGLLTLSWPVDYWDRLGWKDTFGSPAHTERQIAYNQRLGRRGVYTPQMVFDGRFQGVGSRKSEIRQALFNARSDDHIYVAPGTGLDGQTIRIDLPKTDLSNTGSIAVRVVWFLADADVQIGRGENRGRKLHYTNVVRQSDILGQWTGEMHTLELETSIGAAAGADHLAVLLHEKNGHGAIIGASSVKFTH